MGTDAYPLGLLMQGRLAVVVGGGSVAARRVASLLAAGADVLVIAPALSPALRLESKLGSGPRPGPGPGLGPRLEGPASGGHLTVRQRAYVASDLDGAWLVFACTGQPGLDAAVGAEAERRRIWCCGDNDAAASSFARGTAGAAPAHVTAAGTSARTGTPEADKAAGPARPASSPHRVLVLGGARSGKSVTAERLLADHARVDYVATGPVPDPGDAEWGARVLLHQKRRPSGWRTIETLELERELAGASPDGAARGTLHGAAAPVLVDCLSTWLAGVMDDCGIWAELPEADHALARRMEALVEAWRTTPRHIVAVSNEVGSGVVPGTASGRRFRDELGSLNARIAAECDEVWLCVAGIARRLR